MLYTVAAKSMLWRWRALPPNDRAIAALALITELRSEGLVTQSLDGMPPPIAAKVEEALRALENWNKVDA